MEDNEAFVICVFFFFGSILAFTGLQLHHIHKNYETGLQQCIEPLANGQWKSYWCYSGAPTVNTVVVKGGK